jgi:NACHT domain
MIIETAAIVALLKKPFQELLESSKDGLKSYFQGWQTDAAIETLVVKIEEVEKLFTIASRNKSTISEIYYPAKIKEGRSTRVINRSTELLSTKSRCAVVLGTAGQGKSTFLRFLCVQDLKQGLKIPLYIELRKIDSETDLLGLIKKYLITLGFKIDFLDDALREMLDRGIIRLYLDGYDEIKREHALSTRDQIQTLLARHLRIEVVLSSRPGALSNHLMDLARSNQFEIAPLVEGDFEPFFQKIGVEIDTSKRLISAIKRSRVQIKNLLSTPLMLTLLVMTCGMKQDLPDTLPEFFDSLFNLLASTHDGVKPGFVRQRATGLSNSDLEKLFRAFCFISRESIGKVTLTSPQFEMSLKEAEKLTDLNCTTDGFRTDVTETICLMVKEGLDTTFAHKSIQEYYAASFIRHLDNEDLCKEIYTSLAGANLLSWINELRFLEDFDDAKYAKYFGIPQGEEFLKKFGYSPKKKLLQKNVDDALKDLDIKVFVTSVSQKIFKVHYSNGNGKLSSNRYLIDLLHIISSELASLPAQASSTNVEDPLEFAKLNRLIKKYPSVKKAVSHACQRCTDDVWAKTQKMQIKNEKLNTSLLSIVARFQKSSG